MNLLGYFKGGGVTKLGRVELEVDLRERSREWIQIKYIACIYEIIK